MSEIQDYKKLLTEVLQKQMIILGPDITLLKARNVKSITVADDGTVTDIQGSAQDAMKQLINQFVELSGMIVKKTMEPLLSLHPELAEAPDLSSSPSVQTDLSEKKTELST